MNIRSSLALRVAALCLSLGVTAAAPLSASAATIQVDFSNQFFGTIEYPNSIVPFLNNPVGTGSMLINTATSAATGSALINDGSNSFVLPNAFANSIDNWCGAGCDLLSVSWRLIDGWGDIFHMSVNFIDASGLGVVGSSLTTNVSGWTYNDVRLDRGSDNTCCGFNPMDGGILLNAQVFVVPEPAGLALLGLGLAGLGFQRRRKA